ncbi:MAG TPA: NAD-dependent epimerase [Trueperaceae bacterium]
MSRILLTGAAGFIGYHVTEELLRRGYDVVGVDNLNPYYDVRLKEARLGRLKGREGFEFRLLDLSDRPEMERLFETVRPERVVHLAAQAGVRYSLTAPHAYIDSNLVGFQNILEGCRNTSVDHLVYASSSSVYGANASLPYSVSDRADHPVSLYAATKRANELMAHTYSHLFRLPTTGLRFFTVYGPWGRPDMALFLFTSAILEGRPIEVFNEGRMKRDFTYIDDAVAGVVSALERVAAPDPNWSAADPTPEASNAPYRLYNLGSDRPVELSEMISLLESALGREANKHYRPLQPGDVVATWADIEDSKRDLDYRPSTPMAEGIRRFVDWYQEHYAAIATAR